jgi:hypothetical protein
MAVQRITDDSSKRTNVAPLYVQIRTFICRPVQNYWQYVVFLINTSLLYINAEYDKPNTYFCKWKIIVNQVLDVFV